MREGPGEREGGKKRGKERRMGEREGGRKKVEKREGWR